MIARPDLLGGDDGVDRADLHRPVDVVDAVELGRDLADLLGAHGRAQLGQLDGEQPVRSGRVGLGEPGLEVGDPGVGRGARVDLARRTRPPPPGRRR